ncbi:glycosyltransferase family 2 protein [Paraburkholderia sp. DHOC27]|uniref:glycosyltransferase family 2 protein n=1 Tax=Paraburkholderia sp. DHOC27 TaxID=2303330 RepID=UPI000E3D6966|nr:glycosyltransferase family 2 protein [Paraburkholderia sp. DHOC27]RFU46010.1 glycosyltransferase family 2 protein [Paraburkholderia sp. DHOC27]
MTLVSAHTSGKPFLSVVILCYNLENFIGDCLESVLSQDLDVPFEVIVGDDGSRDGSVAIIEKFCARYPGVVKLISHAQNVGYSRNLSDVIAATLGEYIATIDGDDVMLPGKLKRQLEFLETQREFGMVVHKMRPVNAVTGETVDFPLPREKPAVFDAQYLIEQGPFFFNSSAMFRGALRRRYPVDLELKVVADVANLMQSFYGTQARYLDEEMGLYRVNPKGFTSSIIKNPARHETNISDMMRTCMMAETLGMDKAVVDRGRARLFLTSAIMYLETGHYDDFERCIASSMRFAKLGTKQAGLHALRRWPRALHPLYTLAKQMAGRQPVRA